MNIANQIAADTPEQREWLAGVIRDAAIAQADRQAALNSHIITLKDAMLLARTDTLSAWARWARKWRVKSVSHGRYARRDVENALRLEAGERGEAARDRFLEGKKAV